MSLTAVMLLNLLAVLAVMGVAWLVHLWRGKVSVVDGFWGPGFAVVAWLTYLLTGGTLERGILLVALVSLWAVRLAAHVTRRNWGKPEDPRYADMRADRPEVFWIRSLVTVFGLQAVLVWILALPLQLGIAASAPPELTWLDLLGLLLWSFGFYWEAVGDEQLYRFKADPANKGRILDTGLWRYTRHPNYFGETVMWWAIFVVACQVPGGAWTGISPLLLTFLLLKVSGVTLTEKKMGERHSELAAYKQRVSPFFPRPPKERKR